MIDERFVWPLWAVAVAGFTAAIAGGEQQGMPAFVAQAPAHAEAESDVESAAAPASISVIKRSADGFFYVDGTVNQTPVRFLIDTGASTVVLSPADAARVGLAVPDSSSGIQIQTASGSAPMAWVETDYIAVAGSKLRKTIVAVPAHGLRVSLLGMAALAELGKISFDGNSLTIHHAGAAVESDKDESL